MKLEKSPQNESAVEKTLTALKFLQACFKKRIFSIFVKTFYLILFSCFETILLS